MKNSIYIGRDPKQCDIIIDTITVSRKHGEFFKDDNRIAYRDLHSKNSTLINKMSISGTCRLKEKDVISIGRATMIYTNGMLLYLKSISGGHLSISHLTKEVMDYERVGKRKTILNDVSVDIQSAELVAVLGTSGAGKSTFLNCINGYEEATTGQVLINNVDMYRNKRQVRKQIGYVPQDDLLRDGLSVYSTLDYIAKLRLPKDVNKAERRRIIDQSLKMLSIEKELWKSKIRKLSGGQRKRVSIASEIISDPLLLFLDEPTSGLDPETETNLIKQLRHLAHAGQKTLIVITHTLKNIMLFDKILFLGPGGKLCYFGSSNSILSEFKVDDIIDVYPLIRKNPDDYAQRYKKTDKE